MTKPSSTIRCYQKFAFAVTGLIHAVKTQNSFWVHLPVALAAMGIGYWLELEPWRWVSIVVAIAMVLSSELLNTAIEEMVRVVHPSHDVQIGRALDAAAAAVLVAAIAAAVIGVIAIGPPLWDTVFDLATSSDQ
ncbi:diacylglycerol kinase [Rubripirellula reticaptiva]|uniref:Undecaprenol kinase n=1 Tax=Rubripirellula reticaptiva TaxID=2528013 RepID=A0A5C6FB46_9BACT|nr:diacylglycerol kinase [Rubripirellula reticaptiva]TWU58002.1 Undecaprenol kinase [Rubripirellula reticaptiva]